MSWKRRYPNIPESLRKRDVMGDFELLHIFIMGLTRVGLQFSNYMILRLSIYSGWGPSPAWRGIISVLLLQFGASFVPSQPSAMVPGGFLAYEYVDDGAFAAPWIDTRPCASSEI